jgi:hypothetical protein
MLLLQCVTASSAQSAGHAVEQQPLIVIEWFVCVALCHEYCHVVSAEQYYACFLLLAEHLMYVVCLMPVPSARLLCTLLFLPKVAPCNLMDVHQGLKTACICQECLCIHAAAQSC